MLQTIHSVIALLLQIYVIYKSCYSTTCEM